CRMKCIAEFTDCAQVERSFCRPNSLDYVLSDCMHDCYSFSCDMMRLPQEAVCDGIVDCPDSKDESDCGENWLRACSDGALVGVNRVCDDHADCFEQSDEADCPEQLRFTCKN